MARVYIRLELDDEPVIRTDGTVRSAQEHLQRVAQEVAGSFLAPYGERMIRAAVLDKHEGV